MSATNASTQENFFYTEVTAVVTKLMKDRFDALKAQYDAGNLTGVDFGNGLLAMYEQSRDVLSSYADRASALGYADVSTNLRAWSQSFGSMAFNAHQKLDAGDILDLVKDAASVAGTLGDSSQFGSFLDDYVMSGSGERVRHIFKAADGIGDAIDVATAMKEFFDGDGLGGTATLMSFAVGLAYSSWVAGPLSGAPITIVLIVGAVGVGVGEVAEWGFKELASAFGWENQDTVREAVLDALGSQNNAFLAHVGDHLFWGTDGNDYFVPLDDKANDMFGGIGVIRTFTARDRIVALARPDDVYAVASIDEVIPTGRLVGVEHASRSRGHGVVSPTTVAVVSLVHIPTLAYRNDGGT